LNSRRFSAYRDRGSRLRHRVPDGYTYRKNALHCTEAAVARGEESGRVLKVLIAIAQDTIEESRALIAKIDEILTKRH